jgi:hypothetical protein
MIQVRSSAKSHKYLRVEGEYLGVLFETFQFLEGLKK